MEEAAAVLECRSVDPVAAAEVRPNPGVASDARDDTCALLDDEMLFVPSLSRMLGFADLAFESETGSKFDISPKTG